MMLVNRQTPRLVDTVGLERKSREHVVARTCIECVQTSGCLVNVQFLVIVHLALYPYSEWSLGIVIDQAQADSLDPEWRSYLNHMCPALTLRARSA